MKRILAAAIAALALAACSDTQPLAVTSAGDGQTLASLSSTQWSIFTTQTPGLTWTAANVEVGTRFKATEPGCVTGFRFWRASGETATTHTFRLWFDNGTLWTSKSITVPSGATGWQYAYTSGFACLTVGDFYRVSVNTSAAHVESSGAFSSGKTIVNGPLTAVAGVYSQPTGSFPQYTSTHSFFVDVIFDTISRLHDEGTTILLVEQNARMALQIADRGYVIETGQIVLNDRAENLRENEMVRNAYLGIT